MFKSIGDKIKGFFRLFGNSGKSNKKSNERDGNATNGDCKPSNNQKSLQLKRIGNETMELQVNGNWISKNIVDAVLSSNDEHKLLKVCGQTEIIWLEDVITQTIYPKMKNLWNGCYSEVLKIENTGGDDIIFKISLINRRNKSGSIVQNISSILSDVINTKRLSDLRSVEAESSQNYCETFAHLRNLYFVWSRAALFNKSDKKHDQNHDYYHYLISEQIFAGSDLHTVRSMAALIAISIASQIIASIAVAEQAMEFEHRDLHCSNILLIKSKNKLALYSINGRKFCVNLHGVKVTIIDTTFSRTKLEINSSDRNGENRKCIKETFYTDISGLNLDNYPDKRLKRVYMKQRSITRNKWHKFWPKTNIIWLKFIIRQLLAKVDNWNAKHFNGNDSKSLDDYNTLNLWLSEIDRFECVTLFGQFCKLYDLS